MLLGHFAVALAAKRYAPRTSLGTLILAATFLDLLWPVLLLIGWERVSVVPGIMKASPFDFEHYPISHSLVMAAVWGGVLGAGYEVFRRYPRGASTVALVVVSHWLLDLLVHRPDLPLWPGPSPKFGFGLWNSVAVTVVIEVSLLVVGALVYTRVTRPRDRTGTWALAGLTMLLLAIFFSMLFSPPPPSARAVAYFGIATFLFVPWGYWIDRHREPSRLHG
jgi:membrane-bound metal-dependent hydrolase YbcI (DUF457 family)